MKLYEYESKNILRAFGVSIPEGMVVTHEKELEETDLKLSGHVMLKAQVPMGGRMKAGGILLSDSPSKTLRLLRSMLNSSVRGFNVEKVLIEKQISFDNNEYYLGITYDQNAKRAVVVFSIAGGIDVESQSRETVKTLLWDLNNPLPLFKCRELVSSANVIKRKKLLQISDTLQKLSTIFLSIDATLAEINPLVISEKGPVALDSHIEIDDDALQRQQNLAKLYHIDPHLQRSMSMAKTPLAEKAEKIDQEDHRGVAGRVVEFDGNLALLIGGGGGSLTTFDAIRRHKGQPANYCEIGGNPSVGKIAKLTTLLISRPDIHKIAVIMNVVSNTRSDLIARGVIKGITEAGFDPAEKIAIFRVPGAWEDEGYKILNKYRIPYVGRETSIDQAAKLAVLANQRS